MRRSRNFRQLPSAVPSHLVASIVAWRPEAATADAEAEGTAAVAVTPPMAAWLAALEPANRGMAPKYCDRQRGKRSGRVWGRGGVSEGAVQKSTDTC